MEKPNKPLNLSDNDSATYCRLVSRKSILKDDDYKHTPCKENL